MVLTAVELRKGPAALRAEDVLILLLKQVVIRCEVEDAAVFAYLQDIAQDWNIVAGHIEKAELKGDLIPLLYLVKTFLPVPVKLFRGD